MELPEKESNAIEVLVWEVEGLEIIDHDSADIAQELRNKCHERIKFIKEFCSESIKTAHKAHKAAKAQENVFVKPVERLKTILTDKLTEYAQEIIKKEREAQKQIEELQKKASESHEDGHTETFAPISVNIKSSLNEGWRDVWEWEVENESLVPSEYWMIDSTAIAITVKLEKDKCNIPGIKVTKTKVPVAR